MNLRSETARTWLILGGAAALMGLGMGLRQMPGNVWWRSWRELPPPAPFAGCQATDPDFSWQGQWPMGGHWQAYTDPRSGKKFAVWEGRYTYPGTSLTFIPTYSGGMFEALMANEVVPETSWGPHSFGLADNRTVAVQINGKLRGTLEIQHGEAQTEVSKRAAELESVARHLAGKQIVKEIYVPERTINFVGR